MKTKAGLSDQDHAPASAPAYADDGFGTLVPATARTVTLVDGRQVSSWSEDWRHECEARTVLAMKPLAARRAYLYGRPNEWGRLAGGVLQIRGQAAVKRLEATMTALWQRKVADSKAAVLERTPGELP